MSSPAITDTGIDTGTGTDTGTAPGRRPPPVARRPGPWPSSMPAST